MTQRRERLLFELLVSLFDAEGLRDWLRHGTDGLAVTDDLPSKTAPKSEIVAAAVRILLARHLIDDHFFSRLATDFPHRHDIADAAALFGVRLMPDDVRPAAESVPDITARLLRRSSSVDVAHLPVPGATLELPLQILLTDGAWAWSPLGSGAPALQVGPGSRVSVHGRGHIVSSATRKLRSIELTRELAEFTLVRDRPPILRFTIVPDLGRTIADRVHFRVADQFAFTARAHLPGRLFALYVPAVERAVVVWSDAPAALLTRDTTQSGGSSCQPPR